MLLPGRDSPHGSLAPLLVAMTVVTGDVDSPVIAKHNVGI
jgi:hypothetical protein